jgi:hypothetical protein
VPLTELFDKKPNEPRHHQHPEDDEKRMRLAPLRIARERDGTPSAHHVRRLASPAD